MPQRLPIVNQDDGQWGTIIRQYLMKEHFNDDTDNTANGGHQNVTIRPGTTSAAPLTFSYSTNNLLTTPAAGSMEYDGNYFYLTQGTTRKKIAIYDDASGATGDLYYRNASGTFTRLGVGSANQQLTVSGGVPAWSSSANYATSTKTSGYTISGSDTVIFANANSAALTITLPAASGFAGYRFYIKRTDPSANTCTVATNGTDLLDGATSVTLNAQYTAIAVVSDSSAWYIL